MKLDQIDLSILRILQERGKITNVELSKKVGLSPGPTLERVKKLENANIIDSYHARLNPRMMGLGFTAFINVTLTRQLDNAISNFTRFVRTTDEIIACWQLTGSYDYKLQVLVKDIPSFEKLIDEKMSKVEEIGTMHTTVVLSEIKNEPVLPLDYDADKMKVGL